MNLPLNFLHMFWLVLASAFSCYLAFIGVFDLFSGAIKAAQAMSLTALVLIVFTTRHIVVYMKHGLNIYKLISFPFVYLFLGLSIDAMMGGYVEAWMPIIDLVVTSSPLKFQLSWL